MNQDIGLAPGTGPKTAGEKYEGIAFAFCKVATVALLAQRFTLPIAAGLSAIFYVAAYMKGKHDTKCWLRITLLIAGFWALVAAASLYSIFNPEGMRRLLKMAFPWLAA